MNKKSDVIAKQKYVEELNKQGFSNARIIKAPADICAEKDGNTFYFEIKMTRQANKYFGAATLTEWEQAIKDPSHFRFVVAIQSNDDTILKFIEYTPEEFLRFSSIPPFKIFFNLDLNHTPTAKPSNKVTKEKIKRMINFYKTLNE